MEHWESEVVYLKINDDILPVEPHKGYEVDFDDYQSVNKTEAGTSTRDLVRGNIPRITVNFQCNREMLQDMRRYKNAVSLNVYYYSPYKIMEHNLMFVTNYKEKLLADTNDGGIWQVGFVLEDLESV